MKEGEDYYYFDPNSKIGAIRTTSTDKVAELIFTANFFESTKPSPLEFRMFSLDSKIAPYPPAKTVLASIGPALNPTARYADEFSGLTFAARAGSLESVEYFLAAGVDLNMTYQNGWTALMSAAYHGYPDIVKLLLTNPKIDPNIPNKEGLTAFMLAAEKGRLDVIKIFLENSKPNPAMLNKDILPAFMLAAEKGQLDVVNCFLECFNREGLKSYPDKPNANGVTALMFAAKNGHDNVVKKLLEIPNISYDAPNKSGKTALMYAVENGQLECIRELLNCMASGVDLNAVDKCDCTALMYAASFGHPECIKPLIERGIDLDFTQNGKTALMYTVEYGHPECVRELLAHSINLELADKKNYTALMSAAKQIHAEYAKALIIKKPDISKINNYLAIVEDLLVKGADIGKINKQTDFKIS